MPFILAFRRQRQVDLLEFQPSPVNTKIQPGLYSENVSQKGKQRGRGEGRRKGGRAGWRERSLLACWSIQYSEGRGRRIVSFK